MSATAGLASAGIDSSFSENDDAPLPSIDEVRAAYERIGTFHEALGQHVDLTITGTAEQRRATRAARVNDEIFSGLAGVAPPVDSRGWTGTVAAFLLRRIAEFLFGREAPEPHASAAGRK